MLFDDIEVLLVLSKAKSLSQAANQLYMSRPGLSQKITSIEKRFGTSLINRTSTGISLTQAGKVAVKFAQNMAVWNGSWPPRSPPSTSTSPPTSPWA